MFDPPEENTVWILPATKSWEEFEIEDPRATTKRVHVPAWLQGEGLDPKKRGKGGMFNFEGRTYRDWEVPVKYRSLSPDLASKYYMIFDDKGRKIVPNQTLPARWGTNLPYGRTFTYRMDITNDDGTINKTIWKRNAETVRYTFANGSLDRVFWKFAKYTMPPKSSGPRRRTGTSEVHITPPTQYIDEAHKYADRVAPHKKFELVTYADGGYKNITEYVPQVYNRTAIDGSYLYSYFYVPKYLRENSSGTENRKIITNIYGELVKTVTYRPKLYFLHTKSDGSFNHSEKVSDFELLKKQYYGHFQTVFHRFPNGSVERMHYDNVEGFTTPHINKYFGFAETTLLNFTRSDGAVLGTFWKIIKNVAKYTGTGSTILFKQTNRRGTLQHSFWRELRPFTNRDDRIKENDATEIRYVTRKGGFLYGSFKKKVRVYTTPVFRPYTGNLSTGTGYFTYPNGTIYGSHWQVVKDNTPNMSTKLKTTPAPGESTFSRSTLYSRVSSFTINTAMFQYFTRILYMTDYYGNVKNSVAKLFSVPIRSTQTQFVYTGRRPTKILRFTNWAGSVYGSHWVFDTNTTWPYAPTTPFNTFSRTKMSYYTYRGPRETRIINYTNAAGERIASYWVFVTDPFDLTQHLMQQLYKRRRRPTTPDVGAKLKYLGHIDRKDIVRRVELVTHPDGSLNYSTVVEEALRDVTYPTAWVNYTAANGSLLNRLWKYVKPTTTTKAYSRKYFAENEPTETVRYTFANGSLDRVSTLYSRVSSFTINTAMFQYFTRILYMTDYYGNVKNSVAK
ncbi:uncharacterized protein LOC103515315 [Diaphorina citri]|uniref:Uncharacterized protein LOC103515315 n=1 Tax=Diaphorina citri TaxID=121845 RepID=A0A3Q0JAW8_DIACI|nr:uncharacterized protein LOC103515315 [Diaphorina citri]